MTEQKVLIIDDNEEILDLLELFLCAKYDVITAVDGFEGLNMALKEMPNIIVTDLMMPIMNGNQFLKNICKEIRTKNIPVIAITAHVDRFNEKKLLEEGFAGFIIKPFTQQEVYKEIDKLLKV